MVDLLAKRFDQLFVQRGDMIRGGDVVAKAGRSGTVDRPHSTLNCEDDPSRLTRFGTLDVDRNHPNSPTVAA